MNRLPRSPRLLTGLVALLILLTVNGALRGEIGALFADSAGRRNPTVAFTRSDAGVPVVWEDCAVVHVLVNPGSFGDTAFREIEDAFAEVSALIGLRFTFSRTDLVPRSNWAHTAGEWEVPPVLVAWVDPAETDLLGDAAAGAAVANPRRFTGGRRIVTGAIALDATEFSDFAAGPGPGSTRRNLILHEIGHLIGLDHVDGNALMHPVVDGSSPDGFHPVEIAALRDAYGAPRCDR